MSPLPLPIRVAAGLAVVALERARTLPQEVTEWPMTAVSAALQASMRVQQRITELAIKGDEALAGLREPEEDPPWAVFDEDLPSGPAAARPAAAGEEEPEDWFDGLGDLQRTDGAATTDGADETDLADLTDLADVMDAVDVADLGGGAAPGGRTDVAGRPGGTDPAATPDAGAPDADRGGVTGTPVDQGPGMGGEVPVDEAAVLPRSLPGYAGLTLASVRARLRTLTEADLAELLDYERATADRPEFVRMLTNRIATVRGE
ncbi:MAG TPA: lipid droplet-associated protein [Pseudonocardiaceae bacterium]